MNCLWNSCLEEIEKKILPENFNTWFSPTFSAGNENGQLTIAVPNRFYEKCLTENYLDLIQDTLNALSPEKVNIRFEVIPGGAPTGSSPAAETPVKDQPDQAGQGDGAQQESPICTFPPAYPTYRTCLNPKYQFSSFVVGPNNQFAQAACEAVSLNPGLTTILYFYTVLSGWEKPICYIPLEMRS